MLNRRDVTRYCLPKVTTGTPQSVAANSGTINLGSLVAGQAIVIYTSHQATSGTRPNVDVNGTVITLNFIESAVYTYSTIRTAMHLYVYRVPSNGSYAVNWSPNSTSYTIVTAFVVTNAFNPRRNINTSGVVDSGSYSRSSTTYVTTIPFNTVGTSIGSTSFAAMILGSTTVTFNNPTGYTQLSNTVNGTVQRLVIWYKADIALASGNELPSSITLSAGDAAATTTLNAYCL